jgi:hypothetical protein
VEAALTRRRRIDLHQTLDPQAQPARIMKKVPLTHGPVKSRKMQLMSCYCEERAVRMSSGSRYGHLHYVCRTSKRKIDSEKKNPPNLHCGPLRQHHTRIKVALESPHPAERSRKLLINEDSIFCLRSKNGCSQCFQLYCTCNSSVGMSNLGPKFTILPAAA